jgi:two-component system alkaline phosphatase synthesis response regulator PhoP
MDYLIYSVEDNEDIGHLIQVALTKQGYQIMVFPTGKSFLDALNKKLPNMVLLDMMLPDIHGSELLRRLRSNPIYDKIDIIIVSANNELMDKVDGLDLGADDYIGKPFNILELMSRVNARVRRFRGNRQLVHGLFALDRDSRTLIKAGVEITLTNKEFTLLELLLTNQGKVVSRETMIQMLWGTDAIIETRAIDMHIKSLRTKCEDDDLIQTIHGIGYMVRT